MGDYEFNYCTALTSITIPAGVTSIGYSLFNKCEALQSVVLHGDVTVIDDMAFSNCTALNSVTVSGTDAVTGKVILPSGLTSVGNWAFQACYGLTDITVPDSVTSIGRGAFAYDTSLQSITIPFVGGSESSNTFFGYIFGASNAYSADGQDTAIPSSLTTVVVAGGTLIAANAFSYCSNLQSVTMSNTITSLGDCVFAGCKNLTSVTLSENITTIPSYAFMSCISLTSITIPSSVTTIEDDYYHGAFSSCTALTTIVIKARTSNLTICTYAFNSCSSLQNVYYYGTEAERDSYINSTSLGYNNNLNSGSNVTWYFCSETETNTGDN
jgi:hypothetical protein